MAFIVFTGCTEEPAKISGNQSQKEANGPQLASSSTYDYQEKSVIDIIDDANEDTDYEMVDYDDKDVYVASGKWVCAAVDCIHAPYYLCLPGTICFVEVTAGIHNKNNGREATGEGISQLIECKPNGPEPTFISNLSRDPNAYGNDTVRFEYTETEPTSTDSTESTLN